MAVLRELVRGATWPGCPRQVQSARRNLHGRDVVASVQLADAGSDDIRWAVCRPGLLALTGSDLVPHNLPPGCEPS